MATTFENGTLAARIAQKIHDLQTMEAMPDRARQGAQLNAGLEIMAMVGDTFGGLTGGQSKTKENLENAFPEELFNLIENGGEFTIKDGNNGQQQTFTLKPQEQDSAFFYYHALLNLAGFSSGPTAEGLPKTPDPNILTNIIDDFQPDLLEKVQKSIKTTSRTMDIEAAAIDSIFVNVASRQMEKQKPPPPLPQQEIDPREQPMIALEAVIHRYMRHENPQAMNGSNNLGDMEAIPGLIPDGKLGTAELEFADTKGYVINPDSDTAEQLTAMKDRMERELLDLQSAIKGPQQFDPGPTDLGNTTPTTLESGAHKAYQEKVLAEQAAKDAANQAATTWETADHIGMTLSYILRTPGMERFNKTENGAEIMNLQTQRLDDKTISPSETAVLQNMFRDEEFLASLKRYNDANPDNQIFITALQDILNPPEPVPGGPLAGVDEAYMTGISNALYVYTDIMTADSITGTKIAAAAAQDYQTVTNGQGGGGPEIAAAQARLNKLTELYGPEVLSVLNNNTQRGITPEPLPQTGGSAPIIIDIDPEPAPAVPDFPARAPLRNLNEQLAVIAELTGADIPRGMSPDNTAKAMLQGFFTPSGSTNDVLYNPSLAPQGQKLIEQYRAAQGNDARMAEFNTTIETIAQLNGLHQVGYTNGELVTADMLQQEIRKAALIETAPDHPLSERLKDALTDYAKDMEDGRPSTGSLFELYTASRLLLENTRPELTQHYSGKVPSDNIANDIHAIVTNKGGLHDMSNSPLGASPAVLIEIANHIETAINTLDKQTGYEHKLGDKMQKAYEKAKTEMKLEERTDFKHDNNGANVYLAGIAMPHRRPDRQSAQSDIDTPDQKAIAQNMATLEKLTSTGNLEAHPKELFDVLVTLQAKSIDALGGGYEPKDGLESLRGAIIGNNEEELIKQVILESAAQNLINEFKDGRPDNTQTLQQLADNAFTLLQILRIKNPNLDPITGPAEPGEMGADGDVAASPIPVEPEKIMGNRCEPVDLEAKALEIGKVKMPKKHIDLEAGNLFSGEDYDYTDMSNSFIMNAFNRQAECSQYLNPALKVMTDFHKDKNFMKDEKLAGALGKVVNAGDVEQRYESAADLGNKLMNSGNPEWAYAGAILTLWATDAGSKTALNYLANKIETGLKVGDRTIFAQDDAFAQKLVAGDLRKGAHNLPSYTDSSGNVEKVSKINLDQLAAPGG